MKRSAHVSHNIVTAVASMALSFGCGGGNRNGATGSYQQVCGDTNQQVVEVERCEAESKRWNEHRQTHAGGTGFVPLYHWYYAPYGGNYAVGSRLAPNTPHVYPGGGARVAPASGTVRGGFGASAHGSSVGS
jgi:hypothetical protein